MATTERPHQKQFAKLHAAIKSEDYGKAIVLANELARIIPDDVDVWRCVCVSQIHLGKFDDALAVSLKHGLLFEQAYSLYQLGRLEQSLAVIKAVTTPAVNMRTLEAQILYRLHQAEEVSSITITRTSLPRFRWVPCFHLCLYFTSAQIHR